MSVGAGRWWAIVRVAALFAGGATGGATGIAAAQPPAGAVVGPHPWVRELLEPAPVPAPSVAVGPFDAFDVGAAARYGATSGGLGLSVEARYRLDAADFLARKTADAADLAELHAAHGELDRRGRAIRRLATRCDAAWRGWQAALVAAALPAVPDPAEADYLHAALALLSASAGPPAEYVDVTACRIEPWTDGLALHERAPEVLIAEAQSRLAARSRHLVTALPSPTAWLVVDLDLDPHARSVTVRGGIDVPFHLVGSGGVALDLGADHAVLTVRWRSPSLDDRIMAARPHPDDASGALLVERAAVFQRGLLEARLVRADATRRWVASCGDASPAVVVACLESARTAPRPLREDMMVAIDTELAALHAQLAAIDAAGASLSDLLAGPPAVIAEPAAGAPGARDPPHGR